MFTGAKALIRQEGKVLAVKTEVDDTYFWALPGGRLDRGETPREALKRELHEELDAEIERIGGIAGTYHFFIGAEDEGDQVNLVVYDVEFSGEVELSASAPEEHLTELAWFEPRELAEKNVSESLAELLLELGELPKLVRDRIPEIIREDGDKPETFTAEGEDQEGFAREKVLEEASEFAEDGSQEELADLQEAIAHYIDVSDTSREEIDRLREEKNEERGSFSSNIVLENVERAESAESFYSNNAKKFAENYDESVLSEGYLQLMDRFAELLEGGNVLDAGCGPGRDARLLAQRGLDLTGVDVSEEMINLARESSDSEFHVMDVRDLEFETGSFDGIWCSSTIFFLEKVEMQQVLESFSDLLVEEGILYINFKEGSGTYIKERWGSSVEETRVQQDEAEDMLEEAGFDVLESQRVDVPHSTSYLNFLCRKS